jgi:hypothetical protein
MLARVAGICTLEVAFVTLRRLLVRLYKKQSERLMVVDRLEIPENDVCGQVTKRKVGGGRDPDRVCRDRFRGSAKTCDKLKVPFWDYLGARPAAPAAPREADPRQSTIA